MRSQILQEIPLESATTDRYGFGFDFVPHRVHALIDSLQDESWKWARIEISFAPGFGRTYRSALLQHDAPIRILLDDHERIAESQV
jgi:hypothetical protein